VRAPRYGNGRTALVFSWTIRRGEQRLKGSTQACRPLGRNERQADDGEDRNRRRFYHDHAGSDGADRRRRDDNVLLKSHATTRAPL
jgi:hypothetical protein